MACFTEETFNEISTKCESNPSRTLEAETGKSKRRSHSGYNRTSQLVAFWRDYFNLGKFVLWTNNDSDVKILKIIPISITPFLQLL